MQNRPENWAAVFAVPHITEYRFLINGVEYREKDIHGTPVIERPLMQEPCIGRCCTGTLTLVIRQHENETIPKAAPVHAFCRLRTRTGDTVTDWVDQGRYWISRRSASGGLTTLTCRDGMMFAGQSYFDKTSFAEWPVSMSDVCAEIADLMGVKIDERTHICSDPIQRMSFPDDDTLMSEVLSSIAAAQGGNFVMTPSGQLRLVCYPDTCSPLQNIGLAYSSIKPLSTGIATVTRVILTDASNAHHSCGDAGGITLSAYCADASDAIIGRLCTPQNPEAIIGRSSAFYELMGAYIDPLLEVGDTISVMTDECTKLVIGAMRIRCNKSYVCDLQNGIEDDDEDEVPYISAESLFSQRSRNNLTTSGSYYGSRLNRTEGFVSELLIRGEPVARMVANADHFSLQRKNGKVWEDSLFFDSTQNNFKYAGIIDSNALAEIASVAATNCCLAFAADCAGNALGSDYVSYIYSNMGGQKVLPVVSGVYGVPSGMTVSVDDADDCRVPICISVAAGENLGSANSISGVLTVHISAPREADVAITWIKINSGGSPQEGESL